MPDITDTSTTVQPAPVTDNSVVVQAPTPAPNVEVTTTPAVVETVVEVPKTNTVLGEAIDNQAQPKTEPLAEVKEPEQGGQSEEPAPPPTYEAFKVPEDVSLDNDRVSAFTGILAELETTGKVDHSLVQEFGQKAVNFHIEEIKKATQAVTDMYAQTWERQKLEWKDQFLKDPEMGGNRFQTTVDSALTFIRTHGGTSEQQAEFKALMETSGLGNHPVMIRMLANAGRAMSEGQQLSNVKPVSTPKSKTATLYGKQ